MSNKLFCVEDKFECITKALCKRGWVKYLSGEGDKAVIAASFIFRNLKLIQFNAICGRFVNHFRGAQNLSNKAFLAYHLRGCGLNISPLTWSSSFQDITKLVGYILMTCIISMSLRIRDRLLSADKIDRKLLHKYADLVRILTNDSEWKSSKAASCSTALLEAIHLFVSGLEPSSASEYQSEIGINSFTVREVIEKQLDELSRTTDEDWAGVISWGGDHDIWIIKPGKLFLTIKP